MARKRVTRRRSENESEPDQNGVSAENEHSNGVKMDREKVASSREDGESSATLPEAARSDSDGEASAQPTKTNGNSTAMSADDEQQNDAAESKVPLLKIVDMSKLLAKALSSPTKKTNRRSSGSSVEIVNGTIEEIDLLDSSNDSDVVVVPKTKSKKLESLAKPEKSDSEDAITKSKSKRKQKPAQSEDESDADAQQRKSTSQQDETPTSSNDSRYRTVSSSEFDKVTSDFSLVVDKIPVADKMMKAYKVDGSRIESASSLNESDIEVRPRSKRVTKPSRKKIEADGSASDKDEKRPGTSKSARQTAKRRKRSSSATSSKGKSKDSSEAKRRRLVSSSDEDDSSKKSDNKSRKKKKEMSSDEGSGSGSGSDVKSEVNGTESDENSSEKNSDKAESSEDEQPRKRRGRRKKNSDSEDSEPLRSPSPKKKRKRIKKMASSDEDGDSPEKNKSGRKKIRKVLKNSNLDVSTKEAAKLERERKQRIEERQKLYNEFYDERPEEAKEITQLVLDFDEETKEPLLEVDKSLVKKLKPHQANGIKFMWNACFESIKRCENEAGSGCILAHCMGLGKTLQVITLVHTLLTNSETTGITRVLVVCPLSTVLNWANEFEMWLKHARKKDVFVYNINKLKQNVERANLLMEWHNEGGVMILSYDMYRNLSNENGARLRKKVKESLQTSLVNPGPDLVVCDEGHLLKNEKTSISKAMMRVNTRRRVVLTGTPLQNNLKEYWCMVNFVKPNLLGKYTEYMNRFVNPIQNGQYTDSTEYDIQLMRRRAHVLHKLLDGCVQRRDYSVLAPFLPPKLEFVLSLKLTPMQVKLYKHYMENKARQNDDAGARKGSILFQDFQNLQRIWTAPLVLRYNSNRYEIEMQRRRDMDDEDEEDDEVGSLKDFIDDTDDSAESTPAESSSDDDSDSSKKKKKKAKNVVVPRRTRAMAVECPMDPEEELVVAKKENPTEWWMQICPEEELDNIEHSSKLMLLMSILEECEAIGDKLLVFSQSLYSLDSIEHFLGIIDDKTQNNPEDTKFTGSWSLGLDYFRLDGSTPVEQRNAFCKTFNDPENTRARLFLISTRAGGLGINLVAANRVVIFDVSWNPSHDIQSIFRVYRFGQTKPCYIYRFLAMGTMEEKIYERQVTKQAISKRVIDEQQIDRHYNQNDLMELYKYELEPDEERMLPILPKDRLFAEMLKKYEDIIYKYHEHDTLLENKEEETLNEEDRKQAWEEFEAEKNRPQYPPPMQNYPYPTRPMGMGPVTSNSFYGIRTDILLKLLSMKIRMDHPHFNDAAMKAAIPIMMQELIRQMDSGETTLYRQLCTLIQSLEIPPNYGGQFRVNENRLNEIYNNTSGPNVPSTSFNQAAYQQYQLQQLRMNAANRSDSPPRVIGSVIEID